YWQEGLPHLDALAFSVLTDPIAQSSALQAGDVDMVLTGSYDIIAQVLVETQAALVALLKEFATIEGVRSSETFLMPKILKPMTAWVIPQPVADPDETDVLEF
ncbi:MAG TPA: Lrp/AsnC ligand binding domain-containing protein, partial [Thermomicrobiales bacterium]|nr:Lrp/AsnC ligand binding domain-containing protein [Thermomicrobiales bacterium]